MLWIYKPVSCMFAGRNCAGNTVSAFLFSNKTILTYFE